MKNRLVSGVDIGGSHITATLVDLKTGEILNTNKVVREAVNAGAPAEEIIRTWARVIRQSFGERPIGKMGIAMPGPFDYESGIAWMKNQDKYESLYGLNVKKLLAAQLQVDPADIRFINDAESYLKGEVFSGAAKGAKRALGFTLGTGFGSARYADDKVADADLWCAPFKDGIAEDYLSTRWFAGRYFELSGNTVKGVKDLAQLAVEDPVALQPFKEFGKNLALFLNDLINTFAPEAIVLGGNIANAFHLFESALLSNLVVQGKPPRIVKAKLGESAALIGAASCWSEVEEAAFVNVE